MSSSPGKIGCSGSGFRRNGVFPSRTTIHRAFSTLSAGPDWWKRSNHNRADVTNASGPLVKPTATPPAAAALCLWLLKLFRDLARPWRTISF